ncbi:MAG: EAL domain-containing protein [Pseudomonadales bacterium]
MNSSWKSSAKISLIYICVGAIWILASDNALTYFFNSEEEISQLQTIKGWFYILTTGVLLFFLVQRQLKRISKSEKIWAFAIEGSGDGVWDWDIQTDKAIYSKRWKEMLGYAEDEITPINQEWVDRIHPEDKEVVSGTMQAYLEGSLPIYVATYRLRCKDDSYKWILGRGMAVSRDGHNKPLRMVGTHTDITDFKKSEEKLKLAASVFTHAREGITITDDTATIIDINDTFTRITGFSREEAIGQNSRFLQSGRQASDFYVGMWQALKEEGYWSGEVWNRRKNGEVYAEMKTISAVSNEHGITTHYVALGNDITPMKEYQEELERIANYDILTNLPNRSLLADRLSQSMLQCHRHEQSLAVVFLDLDNFKHVNDVYGHDEGDELLIALSVRMKEALREGDTLARFGGDEFVAVLVDLDKVEDCEPILERLLLAASEPVIVGDVVLNVSASIGVTLYPQDSVDADQLMRHADQAMYVAKGTGKNRYHLFDTAQDEAVKLQRQSLKAIRRALDTQQFVLHYQPKVNMRTGVVTGVEALIRWQHPERGLLNPMEFLPLIEHNPMLVEMGEWVIDTVLTQISQWQETGLNLPISTSVNIAAIQLQQSDFSDRLATLLAAHPNVEPRYLELEILETSALDDVQHVSEIMNACMELGVQFSLDDFGTGYSSLTYLRRLPAKLIKIDQSFVRDMLSDDDDLIIVEGVIALAKSFKLDVIAEGVETIEHGTALLQLGCELAQGYGIARPMPAGDIPAWVSGWKPDVAWHVHK